MQTPPRYPASRRRSGFTLIELLTVITIIGILAVLLISVAGTIQTRSRRIQAVNDMRNIKTSIVSYYTDYRKYPINDVQAQAAVSQNGNPGYDTVFGDPQPTYQSADLFDVLRAVDDGGFNANNLLNPSKNVYWEGQLVKSLSHQVNGITLQDFTDSGNLVSKGAFVDPWGNPYIIWIDADGDGDLSTAVSWFYYDSSTTAGTVHPGLPPMGMAFASQGPDGEWGTKENHKLVGSDDIVTW